MATQSASFPTTQPVAPPKEEDNQGKLIIAGVIGLVVLGLAIWAGIAMFNNPQATQTLRDIFIVFLGVMALAIGVALIVLIAVLIVLINVLRHEVRPILTNAQDTTQTIQATAQTIRGTTTFLSDYLVSPVIKAQGVIAGARTGWRLFVSTFRDLSNGGK